MNNARRALNVLTVLLLAVCAVTVILFAADFPRKPLPVSIAVLFGAAPVFAHTVAGLLAWAPRGATPSRSSAVLGVALSAVSLFIWIAFGAIFIELGFKDLLASQDWQLVILAVGALLLPTAGSLNLAYFRKILLVNQ